jgi:hypothetical protein
MILVATEGIENDDDQGCRSEEGSDDWIKQNSKEIAQPTTVTVLSLRNPVKYYYWHEQKDKHLDHCQQYHRGNQTVQKGEWHNNGQKQYSSQKQYEDAWIL